MRPYSSDNGAKTMGPDANPRTYMETTNVPSSIFVLRNSAMTLGIPGANIAIDGISE